MTGCVASPQPEQRAAVAECGVPRDVAAGMQLAVAAESDVRAHRAERTNLHALWKGGWGRGGGDVRRAGRGGKGEEWRRNGRSEKARRGMKGPSFSEEGQEGGWGGGG